MTAHPSEAAHPLEAAHPPETTSPKDTLRWMRWLGSLSIAAVGALTGALVARLVAELWPLQRAALSGALSVSLRLTCWVWSPFFPLVCALVGALVGLWSLDAFRRGGGLKDKAWFYLWPLAAAGLYLLVPTRSPIWGTAALAMGVGGALWLRAQAQSASRTRLGVAWLGAVLLFCLALALYVFTLAPSVLPGDSGEFQFVAPTCGIPHPTGYPLYLLLGKGISLLPIRSVAYRLNLLSALTAAGAVWAVYRAGRAAGLRQAPAMIGAGLLAVSSTFWSQATIAEKYSLNAFFVSLTLWLGLEWHRTYLAASEGQARGWLYAWAVCYGLSLTHHRTMLVLAPAYALLFWFTCRRLSCRRGHKWHLVLRLLLLGLAPLALYLLLPLFSALEPPYAYQRIDSASAFFDLVLARAYQGSLFRGGWSGLGPRLAEAGRLLVRQFGWPGLALAGLGWGVVWRRSKPLAWVLLLGMVAQFAFALNYYVPNTYVYYLPVYVWLSVCIAAGIDGILTTAKAVNARGGGGLGVHVQLCCFLLVGAWGVYLCAARWPGMDQARTYQRQAFDHGYGKLAARLVEPGALIVADWMPATVLWYTQYVDHEMSGVQVVVADPLDSFWRGPVEQGLAAGRPVYLARPVMEASDHYALSSSGPMVQALDEPRFTVPDLSHPLVALGAPVDAPAPDIVLVGADLAVQPEGEPFQLETASLGSTLVEAGSTVHTTLAWQARQSPKADYAVQVRLVDATGHVWLAMQSRHPVGGTYPTSRWQRGEIVTDYYRLDLPSYLGVGEYTVQAAYVLPGEADVAWTTVAAVQTVPARGGMPPLETQVRRSFAGGQVLTSYGTPQEWVPGETASIALQWLACGDGTEPSGETVGELQHAQVWLVDREGVLRVVEPLVEAQVQGIQSVEWYQFRVDDDLDRVEVRGPAPGGLGETRFRLPVRVSSAPPGTNFGNKVRLRSYAYQSDVYRPGETVQLTLEWEATQAMDEAYKVFVHLLGANGLPFSQQDNEPLNGTYPTTRWQEGERVSDPYAIALPADLAPGEYRVEVGLYRISDFTRLPVLDAEQSVVDDKVYLTPLVVR